jgi:DNA (cytosine-5)-methyltransferase 1
MAAYYNEIEPYAAAWLRNLIKQGLIADGEVDERSIVDVQPDDLRGFTQCHFFAGIGGWSYAARLAGWPDDRPLWTGSCPCQPFSVAGKGEGTKDERHLWPEFHRLIAACRPDVVMGEQVAAAVGKDWLDGVFADLEGIGYACGAAVVPACAVDAPHRRDRLWFVADAAASGEGRRGIFGPGESRSADQERASGQSSRSCKSPLGHAIGAGLEGQPRHGDDGRGPGRLDAVEAGSAAATGRGSDVADADAPGSLSASHAGIYRSEESFGPRHVEPLGHRSAWDGASWIIGHDGKARRTPSAESGIRLLAHGVPARVGRLRAYGNAIAPPLAAEVIAAYMGCRP